jgi:hypothetical protein
MSGRAIRSLTAAGSLAVLALLAGCGGGGGGGGEPAPRATGPVASLYVIDHNGAEPAPGALGPYARAYRRVRAGCTIGPHALTDRILQLADEATQGSGTLITNLAVLKALAREVGTKPVDCTNLFVVVEAHLEGGTLG